MNQFKNRRNKNMNHLQIKFSGVAPLRGIAIVLGALFTISAIPFFTAGYTQDTYLQIPASTSATDPMYLPVSQEMYDLSDRNSTELLAVDATLAATTVTEPTSMQLTGVVEKNTYTISESATENGVPIELLDPTLFTDDNSIVYVNTSGVNVRSIPSVSGDLVANLSYANATTRTGIGSSWSEITLENGSVGYVLSEFLNTEFIATPTPTPTPSPTPTPKPAVTESSASGTYYAVGEINVRTGPGTDYDVIKTLAIGSPVEIVAKTSNGWYRTVKDSYVIASLVTSAAPTVVSTNTAPQNSDTPAPSEPQPASPAVSPADASSDLATYCRSFIGVPYEYAGASTSGFDCSGFVGYVYSNKYNISLPHRSREIAGMGTEVAAADIVEGDVICYDFSGDGTVDHVAIYIGGGSIVHASSMRNSVVEGSFGTSSVTTIRRFF